MAWNRPRNNKSEFDPWGDKKSDNKKYSNNKKQKKITKKNIFSNLKNFLYYMKNIMRRTNSSNLSKKTIHPLIMITLISFVIWCISGFYTIQEGERGVVTSFGRFSHLVNPGLNWRPFFINNVTSVNVETIRELETSSIILTSDKNIVRVEMNIQYKITDPADYLFSVSYPDDSLRQATDSALRSVIGHSTMNRVLTKGYTLVRSDTQKAIEDIIKPYKMGMTILDVNFQTVQPPEEVKSFFDDAIAACENREQYIHEAESYLNEVQPRANGEAQRILEEAHAYSSRIILEAKGEVARFSKILPEYRIAKKITLKRLYIESMERLLKNNKKIFIDNKNSKIFFLSLDKFFSKNTLLDKNLKKNMTFKKNTSYLSKNNIINNKTQKSSPLLSLDDILEQRRINTIRSNVKNIARENKYE